MLEGSLQAFFVVAIGVQADDARVGVQAQCISKDAERRLPRRSRSLRLGS